jgi:hypothetical protein
MVDNSVAIQSGSLRRRLPELCRLQRKSYFLHVNDLLKWPLQGAALCCIERHRLATSRLPSALLRREATAMLPY